MLASEISYELSIRLGDPIGIETPEATGQVFTGEQRLRYISRAYSKLSRMLKILMRDYQPDFNKRRTVRAYPLSNPKISNTSNAIELKGNVAIDEVYVTYSLDGKEKSTQATYIEPSVYLSNKYKANDLKAGSFESGKINYTMMISGGKKLLLLLPLSTTKAKYTKAEVLEVPDFRIKEWTDEVPITGDYIDLLIDLATVQGMQDIARADKAQLIEQSLAGDLVILAKYGNYMKDSEGVEE